MKNFILIALVASVALLGYLVYKKMTQPEIQPVIKPSVKMAQRAVVAASPIMQRIQQAKTTGEGITSSTKPLFI